MRKEIWDIAAIRAISEAEKGHRHRGRTPGLSRQCFDSFDTKIINFARCYRSTTRLGWNDLILAQILAGLLSLDPENHFTVVLLFRVVSRVVLYWIQVERIGCAHPQGLAENQCNTCRLSQELSVIRDEVKQMTGMAYRYRSSFRN